MARTTDGLQKQDTSGHIRTTADSESSDSGSSDFGSADSGSSESGTSDFRSSESGSSNSGSSDFGSADSGSSNSGSSDSGSSDFESSDFRSADSGTSDFRSSESGTSNSGSSDFGSSNSGSSGSGPDNPHGIKLNKLSILFVVCAFALAIILLALSNLVKSSVTSMLNTTEAYVQIQEQLTRAMEASDFLTKEALAFIASGDRERLDAYFNEVENVKRQDEALETVKDLSGGNSRVYQKLEEAVRISMETEETEYYAMRLILEADEKDLSEYPRVLQLIELTTEDKELPGYKKMQKGNNLLYEVPYQEAKNQIRTCIETGKEMLIEDTIKAQSDQTVYVRRLSFLQNMLTIILFLFVMLISVALYFLLIKPLTKAVMLISERSKLPMTGAYELQIVASTYNSIYSENSSIRNRLSYEASHDSLTGLLNRREFEKARCEDMDDDCTMILVDVDTFKGINDRYGHATGDLVLRKVADVLKRNVRSDDCVYRIGGDEFAVLLKSATGEHRQQLENKVRKIQSQLRDGSDEVPAVTLSMGISYTGCSKTTGDLYKDADMAMYRVKENGRNGFMFFSDLWDNPAV